MKLSQIIINNFRSIKYIEINISPSCSIFVGKNESGKSNILRAISLLDEQIKITKADIREILPDEPPHDEASVEFIFSLDKEDKDRIHDEIYNRTLAKGIPTIVKNEQDEISIKNLCSGDLKGTFYVNLIEDSRTTLYHRFEKKMSIINNWKRPSDNCPPNYTYEVDGKNIILKEYLLVNVNDFDDIPKENLEDVTIDYLDKIIGLRIIKLIEKEKPKTIFWVYSDKYLLPPKINLKSFSDNPETSIPLKSMFELAKISDIGKTINEAVAKHSHGLRNILDKVGKVTTDHFRNVWKEYQTIEFKLSPNGEFIDASIKDRFNHYELSQRSDGFKRFVTFLLLISAKVETKLMNNSLIIIDEPGVGLHPSSERYLRDELIKISKSNYVFYSTHSIFMIDNQNINRHIIVNKTNEETTITNVTDSNIFDEEIIYNALGYSIFENLKENNIIFEGWKDKRLFEVALSKVPAAYKEIKEVFLNIGICHAKGVKHIKSVASVLELANRNYNIISDSDKPAKEKQKEFNDSRQKGQWKCYDELVSGYKVVTGEDFIKPKAIIKAISEVNLPNVSVPPEELFSTSKCRLSIIDDLIKQSEPDQVIRKEAVDMIKNKIFDNLKQIDIENHYYELLINIKKLIVV